MLQCICHGSSIKVIIGSHVLCSILGPCPKKYRIYRGGHKSLDTSNLPLCIFSSELWPILYFMRKWYYGFIVTTFSHRNDLKVLWVPVGFLVIVFHFGRRSSEPVRLGHEILFVTKRSVTETLLVLIAQIATAKRILCHWADCRILT
jgi:hypothetical protein